MKTASEIFETPEASGFDRVTPDKRVEAKYTSHKELKEWEAEKDQNTLTQNIVGLLGIHGMHCKFYEYQNASHITKAFESLFTQYHQDMMSEVIKDINQMWADELSRKDREEGATSIGYSKVIAYLLSLSR